MNNDVLSVAYFRYADKHDVTSIVALVDSAYRGESSRLGWTTEADLLDGQRTDEMEVFSLMNTENSYILLYESGDALLSSLNLARTADHGYLGMFAVRPQMQSMGIGKRMLAEAERIVLKDWGLPVLQMTVITLREDLIAWYERCGYYRTGKFKVFPYFDSRFGIPKRGDLCLEILKKELF